MGYAIAPLTFSGGLQGLSSFMFAFTSQSMINEIISEMKNPEELPKAYAWIAAPFQGLAFLLVGLVGYCYLGDKVSGMINENMPFGPAIRVAGACLLTHMLISYLIKGVVFCGFIHQKLDAKNYNGSSCRSWIGWNAIIVLVMAFAWLFANVVPFFGDLVDLLGASLTPLVCFVIPIVLYVRWYFSGGKEGASVSVAEWVLISVEITLACALMVFGTFNALKDIGNHWQSYGYPFTCHCEMIWDTCQCSASHIGMEYCNATLAAP